MSTLSDYVGQKCRVQIPVDSRDPFPDTLLSARHALEAKCREVGCASTDITLISRCAWTEPIAGIGPHPGMDMLTYETTAALIGDNA